MFMNSSSPSPPISLSPSPTTSFPILCPKIELHAHISGSIPDEIVRKLLYQRCESEWGRRNDPTAPEEKQKLFPPPLVSDYSIFPTLESYYDSQISRYHLNFTSRSLSECFSLFSLLHSLIYSHPILHQMVIEVIKSFSDDNVIYTELRTTPRAMDGKTPWDYAVNVVESIMECGTLYPNITVRLLLSIDRKGTLEEAKETLDIYKKMKLIPKYSPYLVGMDFSGDPNKKIFSHFISVFHEAKISQIPTTIHCGEMSTEESISDTMDILNFHPDRLGHMVCFNHDIWSILISKNIPIEICPTSNMKTKCISQLIEHPFADFFHKKRRNTTERKSIHNNNIDESNNNNNNNENNDNSSRYPLIICTDDSGVFNVSLSSEWSSILSTFHLSEREMWEMNQNALKFIFDKDEKVQRELNQKFEEFAKKWKWGGEGEKIE